jgi:hypothetical protein
MADTKWKLTRNPEHTRPADPAFFNHGTTQLITATMRLVPVAALPYAASAFNRKIGEEMPDNPAGARLS